jgi:glycosyltransferase involved in cell wall biosynthesis
VPLRGSGTQTREADRKDGVVLTAVGTVPSDTNGSAGPNLRLAYLVSRFPKATETFILREMLELERLGCRIDLFSLHEEPQTVSHPEVEELRAGKHFGWPASLGLFLDQLFWLRRAPRRYFGAWWRATVGNVHSPKSLIQAMAVVLAAASFARTMIRLDVQHVHAHWATHPALAALVIRHLTGIPYSLTVHAHDLYVDRTMLAAKLNEAEFVVTISSYNLELIRSLYGPIVAGKTSVVRSGVDPSIFHPVVTEDHGARSLRVLCVAALQDYKGHAYLLEACARLASEAIPFECTLVGEGPERSALSGSIERLELSDRVFLAGGRSSDQVRELLARADVVVLPSVVLPNGLQEGLPVALIEALAMEVPVVATRISGVPELVEDGVTGVLVPERDVDSLAEAMVNLFESPDLRARLGRAGRRRVLTDYDLHVNVRRLHDLLLGSVTASGGAR